VLEYAGAREQTLYVNKLYIALFYYSKNRAQGLGIVYVSSFTRLLDGPEMTIVI